MDPTSPDWTALLENPEAVRGLYGSAPPLRGFALRDLSFTDGLGAAVVVGDLPALPDPPPPRWAARGYVHAACTLRLSGLVAVELGAAEAGPKDEAPPGERTVDLAVEPTGRTVTRPTPVLDRNRGDARVEDVSFPVVAVRAEGGGLRLRIECVSVVAVVRGEPERVP